MYAFLAILVQTAHAARLETVGSRNPVIANMWARICSTLPFCTVGANAPAFFGAKIARFVSSTILVLGVAVLIYAGIKIILSQGNEEALNEGKKIGMYALGGIALSILAQAIIRYVATVVFPEAFM
jgi:hypothetical protein